MKKFVLVLLILSTGLTMAWALDINFDIKDLNNDIPLEDLRWLTKSIDTGMIYSSVAFAGTIHFYIDKPVEGTLLTIGKWFGYGLIAAGGIIAVDPGYRSLIIGVSMLAVGFAFDLITVVYDISAGKDYLDRKQAEIIYKYRQKPGA